MYRTLSAGLDLLALVDGGCETVPEILSVTGRRNAGTAAALHRLRIRGYLRRVRGRSYGRAGREPDRWYPTAEGLVLVRLERPCA